MNGVLKSAMKKTASQQSVVQVGRPGLQLYQISEGLDERLSNHSSMGSLSLGNEGKTMPLSQQQQQQHSSKSNHNSSTASLLATQSNGSLPQAYSAALDETTRLLDSQPSSSAEEWSNTSAVGDKSFQGYSESDIAVIIEAEDDSSCFQYCSYEMVATLIVYAVNKVGQELTVSSIPFITSTLLGWNQELSGYYMCFMGALVLPMNILVNHYVHDVDERDMVLRLICLCVCSSLFICHSEWLGDSYVIGQYMLGSLCLFVCLNSMEGIIMAILAKIVSPDLARGTFNSALLATEAGR